MGWFDQGGNMVGKVNLSAVCAACGTPCRVQLQKLVLASGFDCPGCARTIDLVGGDEASNTAVRDRGQEEFGAAPQRPSRACDGTDLARGAGCAGQRHR